MHQNLVAIRFKERGVKNEGEFEATVEPMDAIDMSLPIDEDDTNLENEEDEDSGESEKFVRVEMIDNTDFIKLNGSFAIKCSLLLPEGKSILNVKRFPLICDL